MTDRIRLLCLHGYHGSAGLLRTQMKPLFSSLEPVVEPVCIDPRRAPAVVRVRDHGGRLPE